MNPSPFSFIFLMKLSNGFKTSQPDYLPVLQTWQTPSAVPSLLNLAPTCVWYLQKAEMICLEKSMLGQSTIQILLHFLFGVSSFSNLFHLWFWLQLDTELEKQIQVFLWGFLCLWKIPLANARRHINATGAVPGNGFSLDLFITSRLKREREIHYEYQMNSCLRSF